MSRARQDAERPVPERILRWAARDPERPAIVDGRLVLSYGELATRVGRLVGRLRAGAAGREAVVALYLPRSAELVVSATAVLVAGAAYLPLDIGQPFERTRRMLREAAVKHVITLRALWSINGDAGPVPLYVDDRGPAGPPPTAPPPPAPDSLACLTYPAGGTTGVLTEHAALTNLVDWYGDYHRIAPGDRVAQLSAPSVDSFACEVWPCLAHGATLCVMDSRLPRTPDQVAEWLSYAGVTVCHLSPRLAGALVDVPWPRAIRLRTVLVGGRGLTRYPAEELPFRLYNTYGCPECAMVATCGEISRPAGRPGHPPIGRPVRGITAHVLGPDLRPVADGQPGQLCLAGTGVARGHVGGPARGRTRFVPDPFDSAGGSRMCATGEVVRRDADGVLHLVGQ